MNSDIPVVTVDGPGCAGKGTICWHLVRQLGWHFLDSGVLYRLLALVSMEQLNYSDDRERLAGLIENVDVRFVFEDADETCTILLDNVDVTQSIRSEACSQHASKLAENPAIREILLCRQRAFLKSPGLVADGRDMGTVVFPDAPLKVYLSADLKIRAQRRYKQLKRKGISVSLSQVLSSLKQRDERDRIRAVSPLLPATDAILIDTGSCTISSVVQKVMMLVSERYSEGMARQR